MPCYTAGWCHEWSDRFHWLRMAIIYYFDSLKVNRNVVLILLPSSLSPPPSPPLSHHALNFIHTLLDLWCCSLFAFAFTFYFIFLTCLYASHTVRIFDAVVYICVCVCVVSVRCLFRSSAAMALVAFPSPFSPINKSSSNRQRSMYSQYASSQQWKSKFDSIHSRTLLCSITNKVDQHTQSLQLVRIKCTNIY